MELELLGTHLVTLRLSDTPLTSISIWRYQILEFRRESCFGEAVEEVFPGCPQIRNGMMFANDNPGLGIDINEKLRLSIRCLQDPGNFGPKRRREGGVVEN